MPLSETPPQGRLPFAVPTNFPPEMAPFWELWRAEKFWACHEALEELWRAASEAPRKQFLQGLVHLSVAVFQHRRGNAVGAARQMVRARVRLEPFFPHHEALETQAMFEAVEREIWESSEKSRGLSRARLGELEAHLRQKLGGLSAR